MHLHASKNHGTRYLTQRCTSMYGVGTQCHNVRPNMQNVKHHIYKKQVLQIGSPNGGHVGLSGGNTYDTDEHLHQILSVYLWQFMNSEVLNVLHINGHLSSLVTEKGHKTVL